MAAMELMLLAGFALSAMIAVPLGWVALHDEPPNQRGVFIAFGVLCVPYVLATLLEGFKDAVEIGVATIISPLAAFLLTAAVVMRVGR